MKRNTHFFTLYGTYLNQRDKSIHAIEIAKKDRTFSEFCRLEEGVAQYSLNTLLWVCAFRYPHYSQYLSAIVKRLDPSHDGAVPLTEASDSLKATMIKVASKLMLSKQTAAVLKNQQKWFDNKVF